MILSVTIPPAFEYAETVIHWFWLLVIAGASFGLGYICGGCAQRG